MAAAVHAPPLHATSDSWARVTPDNSLWRSPDRIVDTMSYPYPAPFASGDMDVPTPYLPSYPAPPSQVPTSTQFVPNQDPSVTGRDAGAPLGSKPSKLKRSISTPNVRSNVPDSASMGLNSEKRRNKLGYHRTSMACGHCRRRKIRCIPAANDGQGRCTNCIRLKKECIFYPVDQQPPADPRGKPLAKTSAPAKDSSASSSPAISSAYATGMTSSLPYPNMSVPSMSDPQGPETPHSAHESLPAEARVPSSRPFDFNSHPVNTWSPQEMSPETARAGSGVNLWRAQTHDSPVTPAFSPYTPQFSHAPNWPLSGVTDITPREDMSWSMPPSRSMSHGSLDSLGNSQYTASPQITSAPALRPFVRKAQTLQHEMYPSPASSASTVPGIESAAIAPAMDPTSQPTSSPYQNWGQAYSYPKPEDNYGPYPAVSAVETVGSNYSEVPLNNGRPIQNHSYYPEEIKWS